MATSARIDELRKKFDENPRRYFAPLANEYRKSGDLDQAVFILEEYLPQQPGHMSGHVVYGQTLFELGRDEEAKKVFETALSLDPENLIALRHLGHIARQAGDIDDARAWYQRLLEADPRDAEVSQLLVALDSAAQARETGLADAAAADAAADYSTPGAAADPSAEHDAEEGLVLDERPTTHPLAPPPLPDPVETAPPPLPAATAAAPETPEPEPDEGLLDLDDFSLGGATQEPDVAVSDASTPPASASTESSLPDIPAAHEESGTNGVSFAGLSDASFDAESTDDSESHAAVSETEPALEHDVSNDQAQDESAIEGSVFGAFSGLEPQAAPTDVANVSGLESYSFESPTEPVSETTDVGSFYMGMESSPAEHISAGMEPTPPESSVAEEAPASPELDWPQAEASDAKSTQPRADSFEPTQAESASAREETGTHGADDLSLEEFSLPAEATADLQPAGSGAQADATAEEVPAPTGESATTASSDADSDAFATETMAKLYLSQGHLESALGIYRRLAEKNPDDASLREQVAEIEDRAQRRRREPTPASPVDTVAPEPAPAPALQSSGPSMRDFLVGIIRRGVADEPPAVAPTEASGTIDELFGGRAGTLDDDLVAADTLAQAFAPEPAMPAMEGRPARPAPTELSLDEVFRQPAAARSDASNGFSFDQFFAGDLAGGGAGGEAQGTAETDDIAQFNAWLDGLKKT